MAGKGGKAWILLGAGLIAVSLAGPSGLAFHDPPEPVIAEASVFGSGWVAFRFTVPHGAWPSYWAEWDGPYVGGDREGLGLAVLDDRGRPYGFYSREEHAGRLHVHASGGLGGVRVEHHLGGEPGSIYGHAIGFTIHAGEWTVVLWGVTNGKAAPEPAKFRLYGPPEAELLAATRGDETFMFWEDTFPSLAAAGTGGDAIAGWAVLGAQATMDLGGDRIVGVLKSKEGPAGCAMEVQGPNVVVETRRCTYYFDGGPGAWQLSALLWYEYGVPWDEHLVAHGAAVRLP